MTTDLPVIRADKLEKLANDFARSMLKEADAERESDASLESLTEELKTNYYKFMMSRYIVTTE